MAYTSPNVIASGTTWAQLQSGGLSGHLENLIAAQIATANPTSVPTGSASGSGNTLAAGTYYLVFTESNGFGETKISPESAQQTVTGTQKLTVTFPSLKSGNLARRLYVGALNGSSGGPYTLYATGITTTTFDMTVALPTNSFAVSPPTVNSTGLTFVSAAGPTVNKTLELVRSGKDGNLEDAYRYLRQAVQNFISGQPVNWESEMMKLRHAHGAFAMLATLCAEIGTLLDANPGTLGTTTNGIGNARARRTWP
jgi:hypothetical protein